MNEKSAPSQGTPKKPVNVLSPLPEKNLSSLSLSGKGISADRLSDYHRNDRCDGFSPHFPCSLRKRNSHRIAERERAPYCDSIITRFPCFVKQKRQILYGIRRRSFLKNFSVVRTLFTLGIATPRPAEEWTAEPLCAYRRWKPPCSRTHRRPQGFSLRQVRRQDRRTEYPPPR